MALNFRKKMNNRGVTVAEAVVAMAVIVIVSMAAMTCVEAFSKNSANVVARNEALVVSETALEVFKVTDYYGHSNDPAIFPVDSFRGFRSGLIAFQPEETSEINETDGDFTVNRYTETYKVYGCTVDITLEYRKNNIGSNHEAKITIEAVDGKGREVLSVADYTRPIYDVTKEFGS